MVPDLDLQLLVVIKALSETVAAAIDPEDRVAAEQLGLSIATLRMVQARLPFEARRGHRELENGVALGEGVMAASPSSELWAAIAGARALLVDADPPPGALAQAQRDLSAVIGMAIDSTDAGVRDAVMRAVVDGSKPVFDLARAWCLPAGFEPDATEVPTLEALLGQR